MALANTYLPWAELCTDCFLCWLIILITCQNIKTQCRNSKKQLVYACRGDRWTTHHSVSESVNDPS